MKKTVFKLGVLALSFFLITGFLSACKKPGGSSTSTTTIQSSSKTTSGKTVSTQNKTTSISNNNTGNASSNTTQNADEAGSYISGSNLTEPIVTGDDMESGYQPVQGNDEVVAGTNIFKEEKRIDLGGRTLTYWSQWCPEDVLKTEGISASYDALLSSFREAEKKYNCKIVLRKPPAGVTKPKEEIIKYVMSGMPTPFDALDIGSENACPAMSDNNIIIPLDDYIDFSLPVFRDGITIDGLGVWKGKHWGFPEPNSSIGAILNGCHYNRDLLAQYGIEDPQDTEARGQWNWDYFLEIAQKLTVDLNGDGVVDQYAVQASNSELVRAMIYSNSGRFIRYENGVTKLAIMEPRSIRAMNFAMDLYSIYKVVGGDMWKGTAAMRFGHGFYARYNKEKGLPNAGIVLAPHGPDAIDNGNVEAGGRIYVFPSNLNDAENVIRVTCDALMAWDKTKSYWTSGKPAPRVNDTYDVTERDKKYFDTAGRSVVYHLINGIPNFNSTFDDAIKKAFNKETSLQTSLESIAVPLQEILNQYVNN